MLLVLLERIDKGCCQFLGHHRHDLIVVLLEFLDIVVVLLDLLESVPHAKQCLIDAGKHLP
jgi:hypothetical protein